MQRPFSVKHHPVQLLILALVTGCGGGGGDSEVDAGDVDADTTPQNVVSITAVDEGVPLEAAPVLLHDAAGTLLEIAYTDVDGSYTFGDVVAGSSVSILVDDNSVRRLSTYFGVEPGDELRVERPAPDEPFTATVQFTLTAQVGAVSYSVGAGCGAGTTVSAGILQSVQVEGRCVSDGKASLIATALDGSAAPVGYALAQDVVVTNGGTASAAFGSWANPLATAEFRVNDVEATATSAALALVYRRGELSYPGPSFGGPPGGDFVTLQVAAPPATFYDSWGYIAGFSESPTPNYSTAVQVITLNQGAFAGQTLNLDDIRMPSVAGVVQSWPAGGARPKATMVLDGATNALAASAVLGRLDFGDFEWSFVAPPGTTDAQLPALPNGLGFHTSYPDAPEQTSMGLLRSDGAPDYPSYRNSTLSFSLTNYVFESGTLSLSIGSASAP